MGINNVNVDKMGVFLKEIQPDPSKARRVNRVEGTWNLEEGQPQFSSVLKFEGGQITLEADQPTFLGGGGTRPGPMLYCLYGLASCFAATFASVASMQGVPLRALKVAAEMHLNFSRPFGLSEDPPVEKVKVTLAVDADADENQLEQLEQLAHQRCPAVYTLGNPVPLETEVKVAAGV